MKNFKCFCLLFSLSILFSFCKKDELQIKILDGEHPFSNTTEGDITQKYEFDTKKSVIFKVPNFWSEWNVFIRRGDKEVFLTNYCNRDCNEKINQHAWSKDGVYFAMLIEGSNRYPNKTRLFLWDFSDEGAKRIIDIKDKKIKSFRLEETAFYYTDDKGVESKLGL